ncbi:MAG: sigma-54-dependent Fis family transcriptional regulator [Deltaproteobacteria bacterium]|nr:MAG: sigma-54-dependent Fis family transcriptional regulator [Deltaproteobacteria bacterium]
MDPLSNPVSHSGDRPQILVVDDEAAIVDSLSRIFAKEGWEVRGAESGEAALKVLREAPIDVLVTDLMMGSMSGLDLLRAVRTVAPETEVVMMTAHGTVETAVEAMKEGAYDFVTKPLKRMAIVKTVRKALERRSLVLENRALKARLRGLTDLEGVVGEAPAFRAAMDLVRQAAPTSAPILIQGESGTGKELVARALHRLSQRAEGPLVAVNCAAIPESLIESELFGYEKGAFTGATQRREGRLERAHGGTLFLDEIGELSPAVQAKLLRALQSGEYERLGGRETRRADVRIVAATNKDLAAEVEAGRFREDLYYRLNVITIALPPLRERAGDIPLLAQHFVRRYAEETGKRVLGFTQGAMEALERYPFPGNVRQLQNVIQRAVILCRSDRIDLTELPEEIVAADEVPRRALWIPIGTPLEEIERRLIHETLKHTGGDKNLAARLLGLSARTIYRKLSSE